MSSGDLDERIQRQFERLQSTLNRAFRSVPFHRQRMRRNGVDPSAVETLDNLDRLPFMTRAHLGENYPYGLFAVPLRDIVRIHTAPGTTLNPSVSGYTAQDLKHWTEMVAQSLGAAGVTCDDILQISLDPGLNDWGRDYKGGAEALEASVVPNSLLSCEKQLMVLRDYRISVLVTTPAYAQQIAEHLHAAQMNPSQLSLKTLILVGEPAAPAHRRMLEEKLHVATWVHYGLAEVPGPALAYECAAHDGLHVHDAHFLPEIVDPASGERLPAGADGELVLTTLTARAMPLIRFRTGDRSRLLVAPCACGTPGVRIAWLEGRTDQLLVLRGVKLHRDQVQAHMAAALGFSPDRQRVFVNRQQGRQILEVWIGVDDRLFSDEIKMLEKRMLAVADHLHERLGVPVTVRLKERGSFQGPCTP